MKRIIEVVPYQSNWPSDFIKEADAIQSILKNEIIEIYHIGSTSIVGLAAKPVIDILIEVKKIDAIDQYNPQMESLQYMARGEFGIEGRRFFIKGLIHRTHHVHIFETGHPDIARHLNFRDYMLSHPDEAKAYEALKLKLAQQFRYDNDGYCDGKDDFIKEMDRRATLWKRGELS